MPGIPIRSGFCAQSRATSRRVCRSIRSPVRRRRSTPYRPAVLLRRAVLSPARNATMSGRTSALPGETRAGGGAMSQSIHQAATPLLSIRDLFMRFEKRRSLSDTLAGRPRQ
eukprot:gene18101-23109_t